jgi:hypothetical protein
VLTTIIDTDPNVGMEAEFGPVIPAEVENAVKALLVGVGEDPFRDRLEGTP